MKFDELVKVATNQGDLGALLKREIEEGISPITGRVDQLEQKIDALILTMQSIDASLKKLQPLYEFVIKLPFFKK